MAREIGGYFQRLTEQARGGRRLDSGDAADDVAAGSTPAKPHISSSGGGIGDTLKDLLRKGRSTAKRTTKAATDTTRRKLDRPTSPTSSRAPLPAEGVVTIEYSPHLDGDPDPGEVVWTWVPFEEDPEQGKDRPVVVIGRRGHSLVGVPLTSKQNDREAQIAIGSGGWDPKRRPSYARIWRMLDIDAGRTRREGSVLERDRFEDVVAAVDRYYDIRRPMADTFGPHRGSDG